MPGHPMLFDNEKLFKKYEERKKTGFPCKDFIAAADVRENVKGKWTEVTDHEIPIVCKCSVCEWRTKDYDWFNYCPNCGADMREDAK